MMELTHSVASVPASQVVQAHVTASGGADEEIHIVPVSVGSSSGDTGAETTERPPVPVMVAVAVSPTSGGTHWFKRSETAGLEM